MVCYDHGQFEHTKNPRDDRTKDYVLISRDEVIKQLGFAPREGVKHVVPAQI
jgi:hypothetical protein